MWLGLLEGGGRGWGGAQGPEVGGRGGPGRGPGPAALHLVFRLFARAWGFEPGVWVGRRGDGGGACLPGLGGLHPEGGWEEEGGWGGGRKELALLSAVLWYRRPKAPA